MQAPTKGRAPGWAGPNAGAALQLGRVTPALGFALAGLAYGLIHAAIQRLSAPAIPSVDALSNVFTQSWALVYAPDNPPLYDWLLKAVQTVTGPGPEGFLLIKLAALSVTAWALWGVVKRLEPDWRLGALVLAGLTLTQPYGWTYHEMITHSVVLIALSALAMLAFMRFVERGGWGETAVLGLVFALGLLTKYNFAVLIWLLAVVGMVRADTSHAVASGRFLAALAIGFGIFSPYAVAALQVDPAFSALARTPLQPAMAGDWAARPLALGQFALASFAFVAPAIVIMAACFPRALAGAWTHIRQGVGLDDASARGADAPGRPDWFAFLATYGVFGLGGIAVVAVVFGLTTLPVRYFHPVHLFLLPVLATALWRAGLSAKALRAFFVVAAVGVFATAAARATGFVWATEAVCDRRCRWMAPYDQLAADLTKRGFAEAWIVSGDTNIAGNLRRRLPEAAIFNLHTPSYVPPERAASEGATRRCLLIWEEAGYTAPPTKSLIVDYWLDGETFLRTNGAWSRPWMADRFRVTPWAYVELMPDAPVCAGADPQARAERLKHATPQTADSPYQRVQARKRAAQ